MPDLTGKTLLTHATAALTAVLLAAIPTTPIALATSAAPTQTLDPSQAQATGTAVIESGHVDIGPRYRDGKWTIQIHDDHAVPSVWREPAATVLRVRDTARQQVPDDAAYAFLGEKPRTQVHVVPQTERPGVVWVGWNTQDPGVLKAVTHGVTMNLRGVQGPGSVTVFLQSGNLGAPQVLWSSAKPFPQPLWVETNTHTHANWVFGLPGTYLLALAISADLADGTTVSTETVLRLAVGDTTDPNSALRTSFTAPLPSDSVKAAATPDRDDSSGTSLGPALIIAGLLAALLIGGLAIRQTSVRRRAERAREAGQ